MKIFLTILFMIGFVGAVIGGLAGFICILCYTVDKIESFCKNRKIFKWIYNKIKLLFNIIMCTFCVLLVLAVLYGFFVDAYSLLWS